MQKKWVGLIVGLISVLIASAVIIPVAIYFLKDNEEADDFDIRIIMDSEFAEYEFSGTGTKNDPYLMRKWFEAFDIYNFAVDPFIVIEDWFRSRPDWERFQKVALAIELFGLRKHLEILDYPLEQDIRGFVDQKKEELRFIVYRRTLI